MPERVESGERAVRFQLTQTLETVSFRYPQPVLPRGLASFSRSLLVFGLAVAATCNGVFAYLRAEVVRTALTAEGRLLNPLYALGLAVLFAVVVLGVLLSLIRRANRLTLTREGRR